MGMMDHQDISMFFDSLHFYYDYGCGNHFHNCGEPGGALLRSLYVGLLPCVQSSAKGGHRHPTLGGCVHAHHGFSPEWARSVMSRGYAEVEHRAVGFGAVRTSTQNAGLFRKETGEPSNASAFMDSGVAAMWYTYRRGSGIFYRLGRALTAPGKTSMVAKLLFEVSKQPELSAAWPAVAARSGLFATSAPSEGALADSQRIQSIANGSASCAERHVQPCRCRYVLHDAWDDAMVWLARSLKYESLFITATLLCNQPLPGDSVSSNARGFAMAYPEVVDVRPLDEGMLEEQAKGVHSFLQGEGELRSRRKRPEIADLWIDKMRADGLLSLRDPFDPGRKGAPWKPCEFSVQRWTIQCQGRVKQLATVSVEPLRHCGLRLCRATLPRIVRISLILGRCRELFR